MPRLLPLISATLTGMPSTAQVASVGQPNHAVDRPDLGAEAIYVYGRRDGKNPMVPRLPEFSQPRGCELRGPHLAGPTATKTASGP